MIKTNQHKVGQVLKYVCLTTALVVLRPVWADTVFVDPLDIPAHEHTRLAERQLMAVTSAGDRLVAVGPRGLVIHSNDNGHTWSQAHVPVQSDLLAVHFPTAKKGWAVGHDGVILHSNDGGTSWKKQLDGRDAEIQFKEYYRALGPEGARPLNDLELNYRAGPALPFLDVWFEDEQRGYAVGSFGMIVSTTDGGISWEPWLHRVDNPQALHLNAIHGSGGEIYLAGERGQIFHFDRDARHFQRTDTGYNGSFFGIEGNAEALIAYGLRGTVYRSSGIDRAQHWEPLAVPTDQTLVAAMSGPGPNQFHLLSTVGEIIQLDGAGMDARLVKTIGKARRVTDIAVTDSNQVALSGLNGVRQITLHDASDDPFTAAQ